MWLASRECDYGYNYKGGPEEEECDETKYISTSTLFVEAMRKTGV